MSFSISKLFNRISTMRPSTAIMSIAVVGVSVLLLSGLVYDVVNQPPPAVYYNNKFYFLYPSINEQFGFDTVVSGLLYVVGFIGLLTIFTSARNANKPRQAYMTLIVGSTLLLISYLFLEYFVHLKLIGG
jgi:hypothetical protein